MAETSEFRLLPAALRDLEEIWQYTVQRWGQAQADRYTDVLHAVFQPLALAPKVAPTIDHIRPGYT